MASRPLLLLAAAALVLLGACGGDSSPDPETTATSTTIASIPTATPFPTQPNATIVSGVPDDTPADVTYIVEPGDTLSEVAARFETTVNAIMALNELTDATLIFVGQELLIPTGATDDPASDDDGDGDDAAGPRDASVYVVKSGDTGFAIANAFGTTVEELANANDMTVEELGNLSPGDVLNLPRPR